MLSTPQLSKTKLTRWNTHCHPAKKNSTRQCTMVDCNTPQHITTWQNPMYGLQCISTSSGSTNNKVVLRYGVMQ